MADQLDWTGNYFNYFTETEEHFQKARGTGLFLMSPLDWALVESWKNSAVPLEAVLRGIDEAFLKWRSKKTKTQMVNSLAYCSQAILSEAERMANNLPQSAKKDVTAPFSMEDLTSYLSANAAKIEALGYSQSTASLNEIISDVEKHYNDLEALEQRLTVMEEKLAAEVRAKQSEEELLKARQELESALRPHRSKMTAAQLMVLEKNYMDRRLFNSAGLPRLSLFYLV